MPRVLHELATSLLHVFRSLRSSATSVNSLAIAVAKGKRKVKCPLAPKATGLKWYVSLLLKFHWLKQGVLPNFKWKETGSTVLATGRKYLWAGLQSRTMDWIFLEKFREIEDRAWHLGTKQVGKLEQLVKRRTLALGVRGAPEDSIFHQRLNRLICQSWKDPWRGHSRLYTPEFQVAALPLNCCVTFVNWLDLSVSVSHLSKKIAVSFIPQECFEYPTSPV